MDHIKHALDWAAVGTAIATLAGWLPNIAAFFSIVWLSMQMYDWIKKHRSP